MAPNNTAAENSGGVYVNNSTFIMQSGTIAVNEAGNKGGGMYINNTGTLNITGISMNSKISNNIADSGDNDAYLCGDDSQSAGIVKGNITYKFSNKPSGDEISPPFRNDWSEADVIEWGAGDIWDPAS